MSKSDEIQVGHIDFNPNWQKTISKDNEIIAEAEFKVEIGKSQTRVFALQEYIKHLRQEDLVTALCQCVASIDEEHLSQALEQMSNEDLAQVCALGQQERWDRERKYAEEKLLSTQKEEMTNG